MANVANNLLMLGLSNIRRKLFDLQAFHKQAHILNFTGIIIYFCGTYYLYAPPPRATGNVVLFFSRQKRHLGAYYRIKF